MQLEEYRITHGLTYRELAKQLKLSKSTTYNICQGGHSTLTLNNAKKIVKGSGNKVTYDDLFPGGQR